MSVIMKILCVHIISNNESFRGKGGHFTRDIIVGRPCVLSRAQALEGTFSH